MKNKFFSRLAAIGSALVLAFLVVQACGKPEDLTKDVLLSVDNDLIRVPLSIRFLDPSVTASGQSGDAQRDMKDVKIKVSFVGTNLDKLFTTTGQKLTSLTELDGGQLDIAVKKTDFVGGSAANAINFSIIAEAANYLRTLKSFSINDTIPQFETFSMVNLTNAAQGIKVKVAANVLSVTNGAVTATRDVVVSDSAKVTIPAGTILKDKNGNNLSGNLSVQLAQFSPSDPIAASMFPGGFNPTEVKDENGTSLGAGTFTSLGFIALDMDVNGTPVKQFGGNPISVTVDISPNLRNPDTGNPLQVGDIVPIWSLNETTGEWKREGTGTISGTAASPKMTFTQTHLSYWNIDYFNPVCKYSQRFNWPSNIAAGSYYVELMNGRTGAVVKGSWQYINPNHSFYNNVILYNLPNISDMYFKIYSSVNNPLCPRSQTFTQTQHFNICNLGTSLALTANTPSSVEPVLQIFASGSCASNPRVIIRPTLTVWFRPAGCWYWSPLGVMSNGALSTTAIRTRESYDFVVVINRVPFYFYNITIPQQANYVLPNIAIPQSYCSSLF